MSRSLAVVLFAMWFVVGSLFGAAVINESISNKCLRLGGFFVGNKTFECKEKP